MKFTVTCKSKVLIYEWFYITVRKFSGEEVSDIGGFHVTSSPPCWWTVNKRSLISWLCLSTSICSFHHCYLCLPRLYENHLLLLTFFFFQYMSFWVSLVSKWKHFVFRLVKVKSLSELCLLSRESFNQVLYLLVSKNSLSPQTLRPRLIIELFMRRTKLRS